MDENKNIENPEENNSAGDGKITGEVKISTPFIKWLDNFWYHYKWHTIAAIAVIIVVVMCSFQMCQKTSYDLYIMYAGGGQISMSADKDGDVSSYQKILSALKQYSPDSDGDGEQNVNFLNLYVPSQAELDKVVNGADSFALGAVNENRKTLNENMLYGKYHICLLAEHLVADITGGDKANPLAPITAYVSGNDDILLYGEWGVYLKSTELYSKPGFNILPEDTVICLRRNSTVMGSGVSEEAYLQDVETFRRLLGIK